MTVRDLVQFLLLNSDLDDKVMIVDGNGEVKDFALNDFSRHDDKFFLELEEN